MKILYHHRIASKDGQYVHVEELTRALKAEGHEIIMVEPASVGASSFGGENRLVSQLKRLLPRFSYELLEFGYSLIAYRKLRQAVQRYSPDCLYERYNLFCPAGVWIKKRFGLPLLSEVNAPLFEERSEFGRISLRRLAAWSERYVWRNADIVLPVTRVLADRIEEVGVSQERIDVIPNGIDPQRFAHQPDTEEAKRRLGLSGREVLGFTGFMREWHNLERVLDLVAADETGRNFALLVGDGPVRAALEEQVRTLGIEDRVRITGVVERENIADFVAAFDIALQPHVVDYASPLKLFEYMALGKAIVAPSTPNIQEILVHGRNALLFDPEEEGGLEDAVQRLLGDGALRDQLGAAARETIHSRDLTWRGNARRVGHHFAELVSRRRIQRDEMEHSKP